MKTYLNYAIMPEFLQRYFPDLSARLVGLDRNIDSGYFDIVSFFGKDAIDPEDVPVFHQAQPYQFVNSRIAAFAGEREEEMKQAGRLYEGPFVTRVVSAHIRSKLASVTVQPCRYGDQAGSCFSLDWQDERFAEHGGTLREYYKRTVKSSVISDIPFPLCFGVCGFLLIRNETEPDTILLMHRSGRLASLENSVGPSMAGAVDYDKADVTLGAMLFRSAHQEIAEELFLTQDEYTLVPLAYAREIFRGERPQLFCLVVTDLSSQEIAERLHAAKTQKSEFSRFEWVRLVDGKLPDSALSTLNHEARMSYWLMREYLNYEAKKPR